MELQESPRPCTPTMRPPHRRDSRTSSTYKRHLQTRQPWRQTTPSPRLHGRSEEDGQRQIERSENGQNCHFEKLSANTAPPTTSHLGNSPENAGDRPPVPGSSTSRGELSGISPNATKGQAADPTTTPRARGTKTTMYRRAGHPLRPPLRPAEPPEGEGRGAGGSGTGSRDGEERSRREDKERGRVPRNLCPFVFLALNEDYSSQVNNPISS